MPLLHKLSTSDSIAKIRIALAGSSVAVRSMAAAAVIRLSPKWV
jgi:hypothetical protein